MKKISISLTDGFKLRNLIKNKIIFFQRDFCNLPISYEPDVDGKKIEFLNIKYGSINQMVELCLNLQQTLGNLNEKIDLANISVRPMIDKQEALKAQENQLNRLLDNIQNEAKGVKKDFNTVTGVWDITELTQTFSKEKIEEYKNRQKLLKRQINEIDLQISETNGKTYFDFEIDETIYNFIYDL